MENSHIEWTDNTFNPWWGCMKVSEGCKNCYAEILDNRWKGGHWGPNSPRKPMSEAYWKEPFFFKQWGEWVSELDLYEDTTAKHSDAFVTLTDDGSDYSGVYMYKVGKKAAGSVLDHLEYKDFPNN